jgi:hypothetical protein
MHGHARRGQAFDRIICAAGVGDDPVVGIGSGASPTLNVRALVERDRVNCDLQRLAPGEFVDELRSGSSPAIEP